MRLMIPQAASVLGCERLWLNISAMLIFLSFHAGSHLTIRVTSWTWITSALALDLKRKLARNLASPRFGIQIWIQKRGDTRFHRRSNSLRLPALPDPAARACSVRGFFFPAACLLLLLLLLLLRRRAGRVRDGTFFSMRRPEVR